jgi:ribonuclease BN (tRNA processing enzyme)
MKDKVFEVEILGSVSPHSKGNKNCVGYLVRYGNQKILLDCGNGVTRNMKLDNSFPNLSVLPGDLQNLSIWLSHYHKDHYGDLFSLGYDSYLYHKGGALKDRIKLYLPELGAHNPDGKWDHQVIKEMKEQYFQIEHYNMNRKIDNEIEDLKISFLENHHTTESYCIKIGDGERKLIYTGDIGYGMADELIEFSTDADLLIAEATFLLTDNQSSKTHLHAHQAARIAKLANVKKLLLSHFWPGHDPIKYLEEAQPIFEKTVIAEEGKILKLVKTR